ncbi:hypothetical protein JZ751_014954 [Albula glossodonta]|uniref:Uncharacterized protein n=1 Tax=Albula glossodonta TaxID=121402 RepID=A0A8T2MXK2_9TELE|nr:hypothetical protein JZ751_014954 [Albula glossodonta]
MNPASGRHAGMMLSLKPPVFPAGRLVPDEEGIPFLVDSDGAGRNGHSPLLRLLQVVFPQLHSVGAAAAGGQVRPEHVDSQEHGSHGTILPITVLLQTCDT